MTFNTLYQICRFPTNQKYCVRKYVINSEKDIIKCENYLYSDRNLNKLNKEINVNNYYYEFVESNNFEDIGKPKIISLL